MVAHTVTEIEARQAPLPRKTSEPHTKHHLDKQTTSEFTNRRPYGIGAAFAQELIANRTHFQLYSRNPNSTILSSWTTHAPFDHHPVPVAIYSRAHVDKTQQQSVQTLQQQSSSIHWKMKWSSGSQTETT